MVFLRENAADLWCSSGSFEINAIEAIILYKRRYPPLTVEVEVLLAHVLYRVYTETQPAGRRCSSAAAAFSYNLTT